MRINHFIFFLGAILIVPAACNQQSPNRSKVSAQADGAKKKSPGKIEFTKEIHNFGTLQEGETIAFSFQFRNTGDLPFRLTKVEPDCGCISVQFIKDKIESQDSSVVDVIFHTDGEWGNQVKTVHIETSGGESRILTIGAYIENKNFNLNSLK